MPGLVGIVERSPREDLAAVLDGIIAPMRRGGRLRSEAAVDPGGRFALGRVHLGVLQPAPQLDGAGAGAVRVLFHGDLDNEAELRAWLAQRGERAPAAGAAAVVAAVYGVDGTGFAARLRGAFCAAVVDPGARRIVLASDSIGSYPLYWWSGPERFVFASEVKSVLSAPGVERALDPRALADYLTFAFVMGERTLARGVSLLAPGSTLAWSWDDGTCTLSRYRRAADLFAAGGDGPASDDGDLDRICVAFGSAVGRGLAGDHRFAIALSGGLDSRAILSAVPRGTSVSSYTLGVRGCADEVIGGRLARIAGTPHRFFELEDRYLGEFLPNLERLVWLTDGLYLSHGLTEMLALRFLEESDYTVLLRGHGGELAKATLAWPFHVDDGVRAADGRAELLDHLLRRVNYVTPGLPLADLLTPEWAEAAAGGGRRSLEESVSGVDLGPADLCSYLYLTAHHRRYTIPSLELFRNVLEVRMPFVDGDFLGALLRAPAALRAGKDVHVAIITRNHPGFAAIRNSNTGVAVNAGPLTERIFGKVGSVLRRLGVHGYRHYHNFKQWMSTKLLDSAETLLLEPRTLERGIFREQTLRRLLAETRRGRLEHEYLVQVLLILELWQRRNVEGVARAVPSSLVEVP